MSAPRIGFLGTGWIGRHRMAAMRDTGAIAVAAIVDPSEECAREAQAIAPDAVILPTYEALLDAGLDGVVIATPSALHAQQAILALERGLAVFCQKPLGRSGAEVARVIAAAEAADRLLGVDFSYRHTAAAQALADLVRSGKLGEIFAADLTFHNAYGPDKPWFYDKAQAGGGCMMDLGVHLADLVLWLTGFPAVEDVSARMFAGGQPVWAQDVEDYALASFTLANGAAVRLACSWRLNAGQDALIEASFYGTKGGASLRNVAGSFYDLELLHFTGTAAERLVAPPDEWGGRAAAAWARQLAQDRGFHSAAREIAAASDLLDRIYRTIAGG
jgi:predicted dehydrogenase